MTATKAATIKVQTNIPIVGTLKYVDFAPSKQEGWSDQICLKGTFDGIGEGRVYLADWLAKAMIEQGLIEASGTDRDGNQAYKVLYKGRVQILREEHGTKKVTTILPMESAPQPAAGATTPVNSGRAPAEVTRSSSAVAPVGGPPSDEWGALARVYHKSVDVAHGVWSDYEGPVDLVAAAATVFIQACKAGLTVPAPHVPLTAEQKAKNIRDAIDTYAEPPKAITKDDDDLPF